MVQFFESEYDNLRTKIISLGAFIEKQFGMTTDALLEMNEEKGRQVVQMDDDVDNMEIEIDDLAITLFAKYQPVACDLRFIAAVIKINNDFERIGDQAVNISKRISYLVPRPDLSINLKPMTDLAQEMLHLANEALVNNDITAARKILEKEGQMDDLQLEYYTKVTEIMKADTKNVKRGLNFMFIVKSLERIGDHATNIAEDIIYYVKAKDIRHKDSGEISDQE